MGGIGLSEVEGNDCIFGLGLGLGVDVGVQLCRLFGVEGKGDEELVDSLIVVKYEDDDGSFEVYDAPASSRERVKEENKGD